jgi:DoxX-like protein
VIVYRVFALRQYNYNIEERGRARRDSEINAVTDLASSVFRSRWHSIAYWVTTALVVFELALGGVWDILRAPQVRGLIEQRLGYPLYFLTILGIWKTARLCRVGHSAVPPTQGVGLRRCALRLDGRCCIAMGLGVDWCEYDGIPDRNDRRYSCVLGPPSAIPPSWSRVSCRPPGS